MVVQLVRRRAVTCLVPAVKVCRHDLLNLQLALTIVIPSAVEGSAHGAFDESGPSQMSRQARHDNRKDGLATRHTGFPAAVVTRA
jgi:hypothetical protein